MITFKPYQRINLFAGPSSGKSTTAAWLFAALKDRGFKVELVREYIKDWAYLDRKPTGFDQVHIFGQQLLAEEIPLRGGASFIISDSPILLSPIYASDPKIVQPLIDICKAFDQKYSAFNIFIDRDDRPYQSFGRWGSLAEAKEMDDRIYSFFKGYDGTAPLRFKNSQRQELLDTIMPWVPIPPGMTIEVRTNSFNI